MLFRDEPTAGVDVELRQDMWQAVRRLREAGVTIILTTHYIEEAELMADRVGVISRGEIIVVEEKAELMRKMGKKQLSLFLREPIASIPPQLSRYRLALARNGKEIVYNYEQAEGAGIGELLQDVAAAGIQFSDLHTTQSSLEEIFVGLLRDGR